MNPRAHPLREGRGADVECHPDARDTGSQVPEDMQGEEGRTPVYWHRNPEGSQRNCHCSPIGRGKREISFPIVHTPFCSVWS